MAVIAPPEIGYLSRPVGRSGRQPWPHSRNPNLAVNRYLRLHYSLLVPLPAWAGTHQRAQTELQSRNVTRVAAAPQRSRRRPLRRLLPLLRRVLAASFIVAAAVGDSRRRHPPIASPPPLRSPIAVDGGPIRLPFLPTTWRVKHVRKPRRPS